MRRDDENDSQLFTELTGGHCRAQEWSAWANWYIHSELVHT